MGGQLSVPQVMLSVPHGVKRSEEYIKADCERNRYFEKSLLPQKAAQTQGPARAQEPPRQLNNEEKAIRENPRASGSLV
jgi:hypothetical protein